MYEPSRYVVRLLSLSPRHTELGGALDVTPTETHEGHN